jgi:hypothetical protein
VPARPPGQHLVHRPLDHTWPGQRDVASQQSATWRLSGRALRSPGDGECDPPRRITPVSGGGLGIPVHRHRISVTGFSAV